MNEAHLNTDVPQYSCVAGNGEPRIRTDAAGVLIEKGKKSHKVVFIDEVRPGACIQEVKEVKSFKNGTACRCSLM